MEMIRGTTLCLHLFLIMTCVVKRAHYFCTFVRGLCEECTNIIERADHVVFR